MRFPIFPSSSRGLLARGTGPEELVLWRPDHGVTRHPCPGPVLGVGRDRGSAEVPNDHPSAASTSRDLRTGSTASTGRFHAGPSIVSSNAPIVAFIPATQLPA